MADNYLQFSEVIQLSEKENAWAVEELLRDDYPYYFEWEFLSDNRLIIYSNSNADLEHVGNFLQKFLQKFRPHSYFSVG